MPVLQPSQQPSQPPGFAPDPPAAPAVDVAVLDALIDEIGDGMPELRAELLADYLADAPGRVATLSAGVALGDGAGVAACAHQLRSGSAVLGATTLANLLTDTELRARTAGIDLLALTGPAVVEFRRVQAELTLMHARCTPVASNGAASS